MGKNFIFVLQIKKMKMRTAWGKKQSKGKIEEKVTKEMRKNKIENELD